MARTQSVIRPDGEVVRRKPRVGDLRWDGDRWRRWSGRRWARAAYSVHPEFLRDRTRIDERPTVSEQVRRRTLALAVEDQVSNNGATVVFEGPTGVVLGYRRRRAHVLHAIATLLTAGLWAVVWLALVLGSNEDRIRLEIDPWGNVWAGPLVAA